MMNTLVVIRRKNAAAAVAAWIDLRVMMVLACLAAAAVVGYAEGPDWWLQRHVLKTGATVNNYAVVNQGQLKNMAKAARDEMLARGLISSGHAIDVMVESWRNNPANAKDYAPANLGQLKAVAKPFYDVLQLSYPWSADTADDKDYAVANIGQLKRVFDFLALKALVLSFSDSDTTATSVALSWQDSNSLVQGYRIERSSNGSTFTTLATLAQTATSYVDSGLTQNTDYYYRIIATQSAHVSPPSNVVQVRTRYAAPSAPTAVTISSTTSHGMHVSWTAGGTNQIYYVVQTGLDSGSGVSWTTAATVAPSTTAVDLSGLAEKTTYQIRVGAYNTSSSAYSSVASQHTPPEAPVSPGTLTITASTPTTATLAWVDASSNETGFIVDQSTDAGSHWTTVTTTLANVAGYPITGLTGTTAYQFRVTARNYDTVTGTSANSAPSNAATLPALPAQPTSVTASASSWSTVQLSWSLPADSSRTKVRVRGWLAGQTDSRVQDLASTALTWQEAGLQASTAYQYQVTAVNVRGESTSPSMVSVTTPASTPPTPTNVAATSTTPRSATVTWTNPAGTSADTFIVQRAPSSSGPWTDGSSLLAGSTSYTDTGLMGSTNYYYRVKAINSYGSTVSGVITVTTLGYTGTNHSPDALGMTLPSQRQGSNVDFSLVPYTAVVGEGADYVDLLDAAREYWVMPVYYSAGNGFYVQAPGVVYPLTQPAQNIAAVLPSGNFDLSAEYGKKVVVSGSHIFVSAPNALKDPANASSVRCGAVYVFEWNGTTAVQSARLVPGDSVNGTDRFGDMLAADGDRVIVGAPLADVTHHTDADGSTPASDVTYTDAGRAYLFELVSGTWQQNRALVSPNLENNLQFGFAGALRARHFVIGAPNQDVQVKVSSAGVSFEGPLGDTGSIYLGRWDQPLVPLYGIANPLIADVARINILDVFGLANAHFGTSLAMDSKLEITAGAPDHSWNSTQTEMSSFFGGSVAKLYWNGDLTYSYIRVPTVPLGFNAGFGRSMEWSSRDAAVYVNVDHAFWTTPANSPATVQVQSAAYSLLETHCWDLLGQDPDGDPTTCSVIAGVSTGVRFNDATVIPATATSFEVLKNPATGQPYLSPKAGASLTPGAVYNVGIRVADDRGGSKDFYALVEIQGTVNTAAYINWLAGYGLNTGSSGLSLGGDGLTTMDKYLRSLANMQYGVNPLVWDLNPDGDEDNDRVLNKQDADAFNASIGTLQILVTQPADHSSL